MAIKKYTRCLLGRKALRISISVAVEMLANTLETAKNDGIKPLLEVRAMVHQLNVREYWEASGRNLFAFVNEVDIILKDATNERSEEPGPLPFYMPPAH